MSNYQILIDGHQLGAYPGRPHPRDETPRVPVDGHDRMENLLGLITAGAQEL